MLISEGLTSKETIKKLLNENNEDLSKVISLIYERKGIREIIPSTDLEIKTLVEKLEKMKETKGHGSQNLKFKTIKLLFDSCSKGI
jgi:ATP-dependent DNA ligase